MKNETKHTPGPWKVESGSWARVICRSGDRFDGATIAEVYNGFENARLIAAAPDLLEACKEALLAMRSEQELQASRGESVDVSIGISKGNLDRAIVKAEGRS